MRDLTIQFADPKAFRLRIQVEKRFFTLTDQLLFFYAPA